MGNLNFDKVAFNVSQLGSKYMIDGQKLIFEGQTIRLNQFTVSDTLNQPLKVDGTVVLTKIPEAPSEGPTYRTGLAVDM